MSTVLCNNLGAQTGVLYLDTNGGAGTGINPGSAGTILTSAGPGVAPSWSPPAQVVPPFVPVTSASQAIVPNQWYLANFATQVTFTMPSVIAAGSLIWFTAYGAGLFEIQLAGGQTLDTLGVSTTGGALISMAQYQTVTLACVVANTNFIVFNVQGGSLTFSSF